MGHLWGFNEERGVYKSTDGGRNWGKVLYLDEETGITDLAMDPGWRPAMEGLCSLVACELPLPADPESVALLNRDVRRHPEVSNALLVNATMINRAGFTQSWPVMSIRFSDLSGKPVAERRFLPAEYLGETFNYSDGMAPAAPVHVVLEIEDPGEEAVSFQFDFL